MTVPSAAPTTAVTPDLMALPRQSTAALPNLIGMTREQLRAALMDVGVAERQAKMRERQIWAWLYQRGVQSFDAMSNLSKDLRAKLAEHFTLDRPEIVTRQISKDGTRKYLLRLHPRRRSRNTMCVIPGGMHVDLFFLPHGHPEPREKPDSGRDCRPDHGLPRRSG